MATSDWNDFWSKQSTVHDPFGSDSDKSAIRAFWADVVDTAPSTDNVLELCAGQGAATSLIVDLLGERLNQYVATDASTNALSVISARMPKVKTKQLIIDDKGVESKADQLLISQFGIEYGGIEALVATLERLAKGARFAALIHSSASSISEQTQLDIAYLNKLTALDVDTSALSLIKAVQGYRRKTSPKNVATEAMAKYEPIIQLNEYYIKQYGPLFCGGFAQLLHQQVAEYIADYALENDYKTWLDTYRAERKILMSRLNSTLNASIGPSKMNSILQSLGSDYKIQLNEITRSNSKRILGWGLVVDCG